MAFQFGNTVRPELGATDFTPFLQGSAQGANMFARGLAQAGKGVGDAFKQIGDDKKSKAGGLGFLKAAEKMYEGDPAKQQAISGLRQRMEEAPLREAAGMAAQVRGFIDAVGDQADREVAGRMADAQLKLLGHQIHRFENPPAAPVFNKEGIAQVPFAGGVAPNQFLPPASTSSPNQFAPPPAPKQSALDSLGTSQLPALPQGTPMPKGVALAPTGQIIYQSKAIEARDVKAQQALVNEIENSRGWENDIHRLGVLRKALADRIERFGGSRRADGSNAMATGDRETVLSETLSEVPGVGPFLGAMVKTERDNFEQMFATEAMAAAAMQAKIDNPTGVMSEGDIQRAQKSVFSIQNRPEENLRIIDKLIQNRALQGARVANKMDYVKNRRVMTGWSEDRDALIESLPEDIRALSKLLTSKEEAAQKAIKNPALEAWVERENLMERWTDVNGDALDVRNLDALPPRFAKEYRRLSEIIDKNAQALDEVGKRHPKKGEVVPKAQMIEEPPLKAQSVPEAPRARVVDEAEILQRALEESGVDPKVQQLFMLYPDIPPKEGETFKAYESRVLKTLRKSEKDQEERLRAAEAEQGQSAFLSRPRPSLLPALPQGLHQLGNPLLPPKR